MLKEDRLERLKKSLEENLGWDFLALLKGSFGPLRPPVVRDTARLSQR